ncbi:MAG: DNA methylase [Thermodesulfobacteriota bacterium]|nr:DNA methylase [Thermodesulfobacteriota bacterium]
MGIEKHFDVSFVAGLALREKQIQQNYRPIIAVHKWFARRPGTLFRSLVLSEFSGQELPKAFYGSNSLKGISIADPFMGGGTPLIEANRLGCDVIGYDINPMAYWIVRQEIEHLDLEAYRRAAHSLRQRLEKEVGHLYRTRCLTCGSPDAHVKYFLWVKTLTCKDCKSSIDLFPGYLIARDTRHPKNVFVCASCGDLNEVRSRDHPGLCRSCRTPLAVSGPATRNRCTCPRCGTSNAYPDPSAGPPGNKMFALEYHCQHCKPAHKGRFFKKPDDEDLARLGEADARWARTRSRFVPEDEIPQGDETDRLHRWGYQRYREMFNARQLLGLELSCRAVARETEERIRNALATNLSDLLRYQNMLCRYDTMALKSLDVFSVHGFPVGLVRCESNLIGISRADGVNVGSGGWSNMVEKYVKAKAYCDHPFEVRYQGRRKTQVPIPGEWIGDRQDGATSPKQRKVQLRCKSATSARLRSSSLDGVFTDPPYFGNVQYAELMDFCYVWLRRLVGLNQPAFKQASTRNKDELTGNVTMDRGLDHFTDGLSAVFKRMVYAMKPGAPFVFTYHHNKLEAYYPVAVAILDAGLTCSASLPCPAEMGASIHIGGTSSSIIDTIFVCRTTGSVPRRWLQEAPEGLAGLVEEDVRKLGLGGVKTTSGDVRCILLGHLMRMAIWALRRTWNGKLNTMERLAAVSQWVQQFGGLSSVEEHLSDLLSGRLRVRSATVRENVTPYEVQDAEVSF